jgi:hypothetical protein
MAYTPPTIEGEGVEKWLTDRGYSYDIFTQYADDYLRDIISLAALARKMKDADPRTVKTWVEAYVKEQQGA